MENLTKENFFKDMQEKYPLAMAHFLKWIDEYKKENNWQELFGWDIKFHHLPFEMQNGILARYSMELMHALWEENAKKAYEKMESWLKNDIRNVFFNHEKNIRAQSADDLLKKALHKKIS